MTLIVCATPEVLEFREATLAKGVESLNLVLEGPVFFDDSECQFLSQSVTYLRAMDLSGSYTWLEGER